MARADPRGAGPPAGDFPLPTQCLLWTVKKEPPRMHELSLPPKPHMGPCIILSFAQTPKSQLGRDPQFVLLPCARGATPAWTWSRGRPAQGGTPARSQHSIFLDVHVDCCLSQRPF